ncbi:MAG TPA: ATP-binding protein, partial [Bacteroidales bacterium]|nr:ATP-binding protein [Bacteroidales bacterium]
KEISVIIAEDDFLIADEINRIVKKLGYKTLGVAGNGLKAIEMAQSLNPDVVIMDIKMPKMNGLEAAKTLVDNGSSSAIIILTAHESHDLVEEASRSGVAAYLTKPPKPEEIERAIYIALARQRDLIESRVLIKELEERKRELAELNATKDRFFSILAHDMRNPVSALYTFTDYLSENFKNLSPEELQQHLTIIHTTSKGVSELLEELFLWASLRANRYEFKPERIPLAEAVCSVTSLLMANAAQKSIRLESAIASDVSVHADRNMLQSVIRNLVSNALKFTPDEGKVSIEASVNNDHVVISISDTGTGIADGDIPKLFRIDEHFTTVGTKGETGSGLGLVLCKEQIERNQGSIWVESKPGEGTTFMFTLPMQ